MFNTVSSYIGGIAVFLIFAGVVSLIAPAKKYKEYIDLVMALGLILILINPISSFVGFLGGTSGISGLAAHGLALPDVTHIEQAQRALILERYADDLGVHLERIVENGGRFTVAASSFYLDDGDDYFGAIRGISVWVRERLTDEPPPRPLIRVERIEITPFTQRQLAHEDVTEQRYITELKKAISNFYQIRNEHINVNIAD